MVAVRKNFKLRWQCSVWWKDGNTATACRRPGLSAQCAPSNLQEPPISTTNNGATNHSAAAADKFDTTVAVQFWKNDASHFSRASDVLVSGFTTAVRMQVELGQELVRSQISAFKKVAPGEKPEAILKRQIAHQTEETEHLFGSTRGDLGRDCRDAFLGLSKTCAKLGLAFWDYLGSRFAIPGHPGIPPLPNLVRCREKPA